ncbi:hypothetical protein [Halobacteriovorax sp. HLS]|uniref:hypothetical protein n=1 Tax=Halobacteriovorax sp. HLS TaxID=2234000 RepID=UPI000FDCC951|nr:hypothetical protein [Halobacteriovorax sp. HLS]
MNLLSILLLIFLSFSAHAQGIYSDFGIARIYCFANDADIELELTQDSATSHNFVAIGGDIQNISSNVVVEGMPNGVSFYLPNEEKSVLSVIILSDEDIKFEGLVALTGTTGPIDFDCEIN